jgi:hypothetical protein
MYTDAQPKPTVGEYTSESTRWVYSPKPVDVYTEHSPCL